MSTPAVTVAMTAYNCERYIGEAVDSILTQTCEDFELIIVDDASTDQTADILNSYDDARVRVIGRGQCTKSGNVARNDALAEAQGDFIAVADGDDVSVMDRLELQISFLRENKEIGIVGGGLVPTTPSGEVMGAPVFKPQFSDPHMYREKMLRGECVMLNGAMMFRRSILDDAQILRYGPYVSSGDTEFLIRASRFVRFANLRKVLIFCRQHPSSVTRRYGSKLRNLHHRLFTLQELIWNYAQCGYPTGELIQDRDRVLEELNAQLVSVGVSY